jgi:hypothetical protein
MIVIEIATGASRPWNLSTDVRRGNQRWQAGREARPASG